MPAIIERHAISLATWNSLKRNIMRQREKKRQEQEANAAVERMRKEQEFKRKQNAMSLEEVKEEVAQLQERLRILKENKQKMCQYLKEVINDEEIKRRNEQGKELKEQMKLAQHYQNQNVQVNANMYNVGGSRILNHNPIMVKVEPTSSTQQSHPSQHKNRIMNHNPVMVKVETSTASQPPPHPSQHGPMKRPRSPSPSSSNFNQGYNYKGYVTTYGQTYPVPHPAGHYPPQNQSKHIASNYQIPHLQPGYTLPQQMEHCPPKPNIQEKYYIQTGGISSGYPIRNHPPPPSQFQQAMPHPVASQIQVSARAPTEMLGPVTNRNFGAPT